MTNYDSYYDTNKLQDVEKQWEYYKSYQSMNSNYDNLTGLTYVNNISY
jgi:hypothetical protein